MFSRIASIAAVLAATGALVGRGACIANAVAGERHSGWIPYQQEDMHYDAGFRCEFAVDGDRPARPRGVQGRVALAQRPGADPAVARGAGDALDQRRHRRVGGARPVGQRDHGLQLGRVVREPDLDGRRVQCGLPEGSPQGKGLYVIDGRWSAVVSDSDGTRAIVLGPRGSMENLCETLG